MVSSFLRRRVFSSSLTISRFALITETTAQAVESDDNSHRMAAAYAAGLKVTDPVVQPQLVGIVPQLIESVFTCPRFKFSGWRGGMAWER